MSAISQMLMAYGAVPKVYAIWASITGAVSLSGGNLVVTGTGSSGSAQSDSGKSSGKWYWEIRDDAQGVASCCCGISQSLITAGSTCGFTATSIGYLSSSGGVFYNSTSIFTGATYTTGDVIGFAFDASAGTLAIYKNNVLQGTVTGISAGTYGASYTQNNNTVITAKFGATALTYTPPSGYNAGLYT